MLKKNQLKIHTPEVIRLYVQDKLSTTKIAKRFAACPEGVQKLLKRNGIKCRDKGYNNIIYTLDETFFNIIDSPTKAYFLGLLYADGYHYIKAHFFAIRLQARDRVLLDKLNIALGSNRPLGCIPRAKPHHQDQLRLLVKNKLISSALLKLGMTQAKSLTLRFPIKTQVPTNLLNHFIRGYFDGDGCICLSKGRPEVCSITICASLPFSRSLMQIGKDLGCHFTLGRQSKIHKVAMNGRLQCIKFCDWMYTGANGLYLPRKYEKYMLCKQYIRPKLGPLTSYGVVARETKTKGKRFYANITSKGKHYFLGSFATEKEAALAYNEAVIRFGGQRFFNPTD